MRNLVVLPFFVCILTGPVRAGEKHWIATVLRVGQHAVFEDRSAFDRERPFFVQCVQARLGGYTIAEISSDEIVFKVPREGVTVVPLDRIQQIELAEGEHLDLTSIDEKKRVGLARHFRDDLRVNIKAHVTLRGLSSEYQYRTIIPYVLVIGDRPADLYAKDQKSKTSYDQWIVASVHNDFLVLNGPVIRTLDAPEKDVVRERQIVIPMNAIGAIHIRDKGSKTK